MGILPAATLIGYSMCLQKFGEGGIRTHGTVARTSVFETDPFDRSGTSPALGEALLPSIDAASIIGPALGRNLYR